MHFAERVVSTDAPTDKVVKVVVFSLTHFEPPHEKRRRPFGGWLLRGFGESELSVRELLIRVTLATAVVAALFVAGFNLL